MSRRGRGDSDDAIGDWEFREDLRIAREMASPRGTFPLRRPPVPLATMVETRDDDPRVAAVRSALAANYGIRRAPGFRSIRLIVPLPAAREVTDAPEWALEVARQLRADANVIHSSLLDIDLSVVREPGGPSEVLEATFRVLDLRGEASR